MNRTSMAATAAALVLLTGCGDTPAPEPEAGSAPVTERQLVSPDAVVLASPTELEAGVPSCNGDPVVDELEEDEEQVRIALVTTMVVSGDVDACADALTVTLQDPLDGRTVIDLVSGEPIDVMHSDATADPGSLASQADDHVLTEGESWQLAVGGGDLPEGPYLTFRSREGGGSSVVSDYTRPVTLNEATSYVAARDGQDVTLVAGPVQEDTESLTVESDTGDRAEATLETAHGVTWFRAELPGSQQIAGITAFDANEEVLDEYTLPPMPLPPPGDEPADVQGPEN